VAKLDQLHFAPFDGLFKGTLAALEAEGGDFGAALSLIDSAIAVSDRTGFCNFDAEVHRIRGEILLKHNPADPAPAEAAFLAAIAVAKQQGTRSFELRATREFPEIEEALEMISAVEAGRHL
jgi:predicted ATPase